jgi:hypothetical protein
MKKHSSFMKALVVGFLQNSRSEFNGTKIASIFVRGLSYMTNIELFLNPLKSHTFTNIDRSSLDYEIWVWLEGKTRRWQK